MAPLHLLETEGVGPGPAVDHRIGCVNNVERSRHPSRVRGRRAGYFGEIEDVAASPAEQAIAAQTAIEGVVAVAAIKGIAA